MCFWCHIDIFCHCRYVPYFYVKTLLKVKNFSRHLLSAGLNYNTSTWNLRRVCWVWRVCARRRNHFQHLLYIRRAQTQYELQYIELKRLHTDGRNFGLATRASLSAILKTILWLNSNGDLSDKIMSLYYYWGPLMVAQWFKVLRYKSEGRWFDSRRCRWNF
jgi:hypothetical protein